MLEHYKFLGAMRKQVSALKDGSFLPVYAENGAFAFIRENKKSRLFVGVNNSCNTVDIPCESMFGGVILGNGESINSSTITILPNSYILILKQ